MDISKSDPGTRATAIRNVMAVHSRKGWTAGEAEGAVRDALAGIRYERCGRCGGWMPLDCKEDEPCRRRE